MPNNDTLDKVLQDTEQNEIAVTSPTTKNSAYVKKVSSLKHKIIFHICCFSALVIAIVMIIFYGQYAMQNSDEDIRNLNVQIADLTNKSNNIEAKISDARKYKQIWMNASQNNKDFNGIKISDISDKFKIIADQYNLSKPSISISAPETLKDGIYNRQVLDVNLVNCVANFEALTDKIAIDFINNFTSTLPGYVIISDVQIKKIKKEGYSDEDLMDISTGKISGLTSAKVDFSWYFLKLKATNKDDEKKK